MCGIGEMILAVKCRHVSGSTSAPFTTTTTEASAKAECDMSGYFHGYPLTASNMHLSITEDGVVYSQKVRNNISNIHLSLFNIVKVNCKSGLCAPVDMDGVINACVALCGQDPCDPDMRSLSSNDVTINSVSLDEYLRSNNVDYLLSFLH